MNIRHSIKNSEQHGVALVTVLLVVALLSILVLTYLTTMNTEEKAATSYSEAQRSKMVSQGALAHAIEILRTNIPEPAPINRSAATAEARNWAINPGRLTIFDDQENFKAIDLHSGEVDIAPSATEDPNVNSVDLNEPIPGRQEPAICYALDERGKPNPSVPTPTMRVKWVNILQDPSQPPSAENPVIARHAFWIDDETNKLNFNTAYGKPSRETDIDRFYEQYDKGMMPALFRQESREDVGTVRNLAGRRPWGLGKLKSVNLGVMFDRPEHIDRDALLGNVFFRGFSRYPEAILDYVQMPYADKMNWWYQNRYHLTFYSRSPEFNAFGRPRLMATNIPLSLEGGPSYQLPFVYNGDGAPDTLNEIKGVLHMHSLLGTLGFTHSLTEEDEDGGGTVHAANIVNRAQLELLMRYFRREFPGYKGSFVDKYGELECAQIATNILNMARYATTNMNNNNRNVNQFSRDLAWRTTSVLYSPHSNEKPNRKPERHYWRYEKVGDEEGRFLSRTEDSTENTIPLIPQTPGPHITEVKLLMRPVLARQFPAVKPGGNFPISGGNPIPNKRWLALRFEVEYYMHGVGPFVRIHQFPFKVDYLKLEITGDESFNQELDHVNWNANPGKGIIRYDADGNPILDNNGKPKRRSVVNRRALGSLRIQAGRSNQIRPFIPSKEADEQRNRIAVRSNRWRYVGVNRRYLGNPEDPRPARNDRPRAFDVDSTLNVKVRLRAGMGVDPANGRPRQMIPLGYGRGDDSVLEADISLDMSSNVPVSISWQIADPRLSGMKSMWSVDTSDDPTAGTLGQPNDNLILPNSTEEPDEESTQKSKFRYIQRGPGSITGLGINRPDEYNSASRLSSKGVWSMIHTGIFSGVPYRTMRLSPPEAGDPIGPPDFLLMDLIGNTYPMQHDQWSINSTLPDEFSTVSHMHSTTGAINLNNRTFPENEYFEAPVRKKPLEAVFKHLRSDEDIDELISGISEFQSGSQFFKYVGELSGVDGYLADPNATQFKNEELLRNMIGCLTTKSNTFGVWGVGQTVKKSRLNENWGEFEDGDSVRGEKRFFAIVERYIWPGKDGVPGNAHVNEQGVWDRHAKQRQDITELEGRTDRLYQLPGSPPTRKGGGQRLSLDLQGTYPEYDGPQEVEMGRYPARALGKVAWNYSTLEEAYNPPQPVIKYRVVYFRYLDE